MDDQHNADVRTIQALAAAVRAAAGDGLSPPQIARLLFGEMVSLVGEEAAQTIALRRDEGKTARSIQPSATDRPAPMEVFETIGDPDLFGRVYLKDEDGIREETDAEFRYRMERSFFPRIDDALLQRIETAMPPGVQDWTVREIDPATLEVHAPHHTLSDDEKAAIRLAIEETSRPPSPAVIFRMG